MKQLGRLSVLTRNTLLKSSNCLRRLVTLEDVIEELIQAEIMVSSLII